ncbi:murein hydrolase activator EnvC family protein [Wenzhouxiangella marina]|uniref:M23ase beta-sheet core domain-containing protein n=1 Tax=Wenzhouxiangella marina TaxID=1579979 RepID=A0A0K0XW87_9GAMM|nr:peptidoglycan DD-metalloendopeptidase family protein [Wenzhouxiangella marina]AKS41969.1 hypothetical protein WM2015_1599 [Wenzhouxiangella marina]
MRRAPFLSGFVLLGLGLLAFSSASQGQSEAEEAELTARLEAVRAEIETIRAGLAEALSERDSELDRLAEADRAVSSAERDRRRTGDRIEQTETDIGALDSQAEVLEGQLADHAQGLARQLRWIHRQGSDSRLKLLLNQDDPRQVSRQLAYQGYLSRQRVNLMAEMQTTLARLEETREALLIQRERLRELAREQDANLARLQSARTEREAALRVIEARVQSDQERLAALERDEQELASLLDQLAASLADIPPEADVPSLADLRGALPWPLEGRPLHRFGQQRAGELTWNGWLIPGSRGDDVRAVAYGRVAYADWLRGYGLILIVDHGDGFMSLYAHNEALLRDVGDWVGPGEVIASVGNSGGVPETGLYFELRRNGDPINPASWLRN